jgi:DNA-binding MarR family transcriptional regulator
MAKSESQTDKRQRIQDDVRRVIANAVLFNYSVAEQLGLSAREMQVVNLLQLSGPLPAGQLAERTNLTTGAITGVVDRLEANGYAHRTHDPGDRRKVIVAADNERIATDLAPRYEGQAQALARALSGYTGPQLDLIAEFLERLAAERQTTPASSPT